MRDKKPKRSFLSFIHCARLVFYKPVKYYYEISALFGYGLSKYNASIEEKRNKVLTQIK